VQTAESSTPSGTITPGQLSPATMATILTTLAADRVVSAALHAATKQFFEDGCIDSGPSRIVVEGGLMMTKSAGALQFCTMLS